MEGIQRIGAPARIVTTTSFKSDKREFTLPKWPLFRGSRKPCQQVQTILTA
jgi:hypothetical protein